MKLLSTHVSDALAHEIDARILVGNPGDAGFFRSRSAFLAEAARRMLTNIATGCNVGSRTSSEAPPPFVPGPALELLRRRSMIERTASDYAGRHDISAHAADLLFHLVGEAGLDFSYRRAMERTGLSYVEIERGRSELSRKGLFRMPLGTLAFTLDPAI